MSDAPSSSPSSDLSAPPTASSESPEHGGEWVVIGLIVALLAFMTITYGVAAYYLRGDDWLVLVAPFVRLSNSAFFAIAAFCGVDAWRAGRNGWWWYLIGGLVPVLNWALVAYWFVRGRKREGRFLKWTV